MINLINYVLKKLEEYKKILETSEDKFPVTLGLSELLFLIEQNYEFLKDEELLKNLRELHSLILEVYYRLQQTQRPIALFIDPLKLSHKKFLSLSFGITSLLNETYSNQIEALKRILA